MPARQRTIMSISLPHQMALEYRQLAREKGESASELFREMFAFYKEQKLKKELYELQAYGAGKVREMGISEEEIEKLVFGDR
jgi:metal-responsive CopG/Arc/MetJ family transcriptional regulator